MIITTSIPWVVSTRCDIKDDRVIVFIENVVTGTFDEIGVIWKVDEEWPSYHGMREIIVKKLLYNQQLTWQIAKFVCRELRIPVEKENPQPEIQAENRPLVSAVPQPGSGLSDAQIAKAARSAGASLQHCLVSK